jgi:hypothetical protein
MEYELLTLRHPVGYNMRFFDDVQSFLQQRESCALAL